LISKKFPSVFIAPRDHVYEKNISGIEEIKARSGPILSITSQDDKKIKKLSDDVITIPKTHPLLYPILSTIPLQLFAYYIAVNLNLDVDRPKNLAKSVTVE
jgi:glucosamine--fructose-6-phosphate aminotransferase (isomerizing)